MKKYVIGVDGGGAKTTALLADSDKKILAKAKTGSSHPRNLGLKKAVDSVFYVLEKVAAKAGKNAKISAVFFGLPAMEEEFKFKKNLVKKEFLKHKEISRIFKGRIIIDSDQLAGFRSGTDEKEGVVLIAGSGCACHGWRKGKEIKVDGWGYLSEMGSAFFVGQRTLQAIFKTLDGRIGKTTLLGSVLRQLKVRNKEELINLIYSKPAMEIIPSLSISCNLAAEKGDGLAKKILIEAGKELALSANAVVKKLRFTRRKFPLVLIGSMFNSRIVSDTVKKEIKKFAPQAEFIRPEAEPAFGAVKIAIEALADGND
jgi:N-acetylglucosamine kinase-like BadF-type ATPase